MIIYYTQRCNDDESIAWTVNTRTSAQDVLYECCYHFMYYVVDTTTVYKKKSRTH